MNERLVVSRQRYVDDSGRECERCHDTGRQLDRAVELFKEAVTPAIDLDIDVKDLGLEERERHPLGVNSILVAGRPLEDWLGAKVEMSPCCEVCGGAPVRSYSVEDKSWTVVPAEEIVKGLVRAALEKGMVSCSTQGESSLNTVACDCSALGSSAGCGDTTAKPSGRSWVKTAVTSVVLVAAAAAAGYTIIRNNSDPGETTGETDAGAPCAPAAGGCAPSLFSLGGDSTISPVAVAVLTGVVTDVEVAFVFLSGSDNDAAQSAIAEVESIVDNLSAQGKKVKAVNFAPGSPGYVGLAKLGKVESFPSVAALGSKGGYTFLAPDEISEVRLLRAFVVATTPVPGCAPGSPGCAPPAGGK